MAATTKRLEQKIATDLPAKFALIFDGWKCDHSSTHYVAVYASYLDKNGKVERVLLSFTPFLDESSYTAYDHKKLIKMVLRIFGRKLLNVICLIGDNCATNRKLASECQLPFIGCAAHRFNLEVQLMLDRHSRILGLVLQPFHLHCF